MPTHHGPNYQDAPNSWLTLIIVRQAGGATMYMLFCTSLFEDKLPGVAMQVHDLDSGENGNPSGPYMW